MAGRLAGRRWMNDWEIKRALEICKGHPVLREATEFLAAFRDEVDGHSDGWGCWAPPSKAATGLMEMILAAWQGADGKAHWIGLVPVDVVVTVDQYQKALRPIKAFYTRRGYKAGMQWPVVGVAKRLLGGRG